jgi:hypothetical protein
MTVERTSRSDTDGAPDSAVYRVSGELFFASSNDLVYQFDYVDDPRNVVIDMSDSTFGTPPPLPPSTPSPPSTTRRANTSKLLASTMIRQNATAGYPGSSEPNIENNTHLPRTPVSARGGGPTQPPSAGVRYLPARQSRVPS